MHLYENRTSRPITVNIPSQDGLSFSLFTFPPHSKRAFTYPALDVYVPSALMKVEEDGVLVFPLQKPKEVCRPIQESPKAEEVVEAPESVVVPIVEEDRIEVEELHEEPIVEEDKPEEVKPIKPKRNKKKVSE